MGMSPAISAAHAKFLDHKTADRDLDEQEKRATERFLRRWGGQGYLPGLVFIMLGTYMRGGLVCFVLVCFVGYGSIQGC